MKCSKCNNPYQNILANLYVCKICFTKSVYPDKIRRLIIEQPEQLEQLNFRLLITFMTIRESYRDTFNKKPSIETHGRIFRQCLLESPINENIVNLITKHLSHLHWEESTVEFIDEFLTFIVKDINDIFHNEVSLKKRFKSHLLKHFVEHIIIDNKQIIDYLYDGGHIDISVYHTEKYISLELINNCIISCLDIKTLELCFEAGCGMDFIESNIDEVSNLHELPELFELFEKFIIKDKNSLCDIIRICIKRVGDSYTFGHYNSIYLYNDFIKFIIDKMDDDNTSIRNLNSIFYDIRKYQPLMDKSFKLLIMNLFDKFLKTKYQSQISKTNCSYIIEFLCVYEEYDDLQQVFQYMLDKKIYPALFHGYNIRSKVLRNYHVLMFIIKSQHYKPNQWLSYVNICLRGNKDSCMIRELLKIIDINRIDDDSYCFYNIIQEHGEAFKEIYNCDMRCKSNRSMIYK